MATPTLLLLKFIDALSQTNLDYTLDSQILDGERWTEVTIGKRIHIVYDHDWSICVYNDGDDLYSSQPLDEFGADGIKPYLDNLVGVAK